jgi:hypothetical protein
MVSFFSSSAIVATPRRLMVTGRMQLLDLAGTTVKARWQRKGERNALMDATALLIRMRGVRESCFVFGQDS